MASCFGAKCGRTPWIARAVLWERTETKIPHMQMNTRLNLYEISYKGVFCWVTSEPLWLAFFTEGDHDKYLSFQWLPKGPTVPTEGMQSPWKARKVAYSFCMAVAAFLDSGCLLQGSKFYLVAGFVLCGSHQRSPKNFVEHFQNISRWSV